MRHMEADIILRHRDKTIVGLMDTVCGGIVKARSKFILWTCAVEVVEKSVVAGGDRRNLTQWTRKVDSAEVVDIASRA